MSLDISAYATTNNKNYLSAIDVEDLFLNYFAIYDDKDKYIGICTINTLEILLEEYNTLYPLKVLRPIDIEIINDIFNENLLDVKTIGKFAEDIYNDSRKR